MPRPKKPARLYFRKDEQQWVIRDGERQQRTGYGFEQRHEAEQALAQYLSERPLPERKGPAQPDQITVGEIIAKYVEDKGPSITSAQTLVYSIKALAPFWGDMTCDMVRGAACRRYERERAAPRQVENVGPRGKIHVQEYTASASTVRRELSVLQAALNYGHQEGLIAYPIKVALPANGEVRDRWLTRSEAAQLLWHSAPHVRRFILLSLYTGRRAGAVLGLTWDRVHLTGAAFIQFREDGVAETNKRRGQVRVPRQLRGHLNRWAKIDDLAIGLRHGPKSPVIAYMGEPVANIKKGIQRAAERAGLSGVTPHVLKHTAITWAVMEGLGLEDAAEYFHTSPETIRKHYWHHSPFHQERALQIMERRK